MCSFWSLTVDSVVTGLHLISVITSLSRVRRHSNNKPNTVVVVVVIHGRVWSQSSPKKRVSVGGAAEKIGGQGEYQLQWWCCRTGQPPKKLWCGKVGEGRGGLSLKEENAC
ncbi:hypothetical protein Bca52824_008085 [Brassica carinata]|uniref:Uncharacterized protein n=1 Tax=Brassica carinata TaxID=52824 RepID=A0A8X8B8G9_BRACI|nr:hypothetical protein Bca52824_008085 [Brassica carinata]